jgi:UDP-glucose 4-epimerase
VLTLDRREPAEGVEGETVSLADLTREEAMRQVAGSIEPPDGVVWLAASIRQRGGIDETAAEDVRVMVEAPLRFLQALREAPATFVYLSSIQVYGRPERLPVAEDHPTRPFTAYGVAKLCGEQMLRLACKARGTVFTALRAAFIYGPGQHPANVIPRFLEQVRRGEAPVVHGSGRDVRDDVYVGDVAAVVERALARRAPGAFNVASGRPHPLGEVAEAACRFGPPGLAPVHAGVPSHWVDRWYAVDAARTALGFDVWTRFEEGLAAMWRGADGRAPAPR